MSKEKKIGIIEDADLGIGSVRLLEEARTFKILVHNGWYVDAMMLPKGIYSGITPQLYQPDTTIQGLVDEAKKMKQRGVEIGGYIENIQRCQLKVVELAI